MRRAAVALASCAALLGAGAAIAALTAKPLAGTTGPGYSISLKTNAGAKVRVLKAGGYTITVNDKSSAHEFHLIGPGVNKRITGLDFRGKKTTAVVLKAGTYIYQCDPHRRDGMKASFTVTR
jgi:plastocyanin